MQATFQGTLLAESSDTIEIEGNHYFPPSSIQKQFFQPSSTHTTCPWKGEASYYNIQVEQSTIEDGAWYYPTPKDAAKNITNYVAFYTSKGIEIS